MDSNAQPRPPRQLSRFEIEQQMWEQLREYYRLPLYPLRSVIVPEWVEHGKLSGIVQVGYDDSIKINDNELQRVKLQPAGAFFVAVEVATYRARPPYYRPQSLYYLTREEEHDYMRMGQKRREKFYAEVAIPCLKNRYFPTQPLTFNIRLVEERTWVDEMAPWPCCE